MYGRPLYDLPHTMPCPVLIHSFPCPSSIQQPHAWPRPQPHAYGRSDGLRRSCASSRTRRQLPPDPVPPSVPRTLRCVSVPISVEYSPSQALKPNDGGPYPRLLGSSWRRFCTCPAWNMAVRGLLFRIVRMHDAWPLILILPDCLVGFTGLLVTRHGCYQNDNAYITVMDRSPTSNLTIGSGLPVGFNRERGELDAKPHSPMDYIDCTLCAQARSCMQTRGRQRSFYSFRIH
jgi:hypothetical protein